jgi:hypothetical protein
MATKSGAPSRKKSIILGGVLVVAAALVTLSWTGVINLFPVG